MILSKKTTQKIDEFVCGITEAFIDMAKSKEGLHEDSICAYAKLIESVGTLPPDPDGDLTAIGFALPAREDDDEDI